MRNGIIMVMMLTMLALCACGSDGNLGEDVNLSSGGEAEVLEESVAEENIDNNTIDEQEEAEKIDITDTEEINEQDIRIVVLGEEVMINGESLVYEVNENDSSERYLELGIELRNKIEEILSDDREVIVELGRGYSDVSDTVKATLDEMAVAYIEGEGE